MATEIFTSPVLAPEPLRMTASGFVTGDSGMGHVAITSKDVLGMHGYARTPSGFELEGGWNPVLVTPELESKWAPTTYQGISTWGHTPVGENIVHKLTMFGRAVASLASTEASVPLANQAGAQAVAWHCP